MWLAHAQQGKGCNKAIPTATDMLSLLLIPATLRIPFCWAWGVGGRWSPPCCWWGRSRLSPTGASTGSSQSHPVTRQSPPHQCTYQCQNTFEGMYHPTQENTQQSLFYDHSQNQACTKPTIIRAIFEKRVINIFSPLNTHSQQCSYNTLLV